MHPTKESGASVVDTGPGFNIPEAAVQQERLLRLKQSQGAKRKGLRGTAAPSRCACAQCTASS